MKRTSPRTIETTPGEMSLKLSPRPPRPPRHPPNPNNRHWASNFLLLKQFKRREGHPSVPKSFIEDGINLGNWINNQRRHKVDGQIDSEKEDMLNEIGFVWKPHDCIWDTLFSALTHFKQREGHLIVPKAHVEDGHKLGSWVGTQRVRKANGVLGDEKERLLNEIGFIWKGHDAKWLAVFTALTHFKQREGHLVVPKDHVENCLNLGAWIGTQRRHKNAGTLLSERVDMFNAIGFIWKGEETPHIIQKDDKWDTMFRVLAQFKQREGHMRVPRLHVEEDGQKLGIWICSQRLQKNAGTLLSNKEDLLNEIGFIWKGRNEIWYTMFNLYTQFVQREQHLRVPKLHVEDGLNLGPWIGTQRYGKTNGTLSPEKESMLNEIGFIWNKHEGNWDAMLSALKKFKQREGHLKVPQRHVEEGRHLGDWIGTQRYQRRLGTLSCPEKERRLNEIGFIWNPQEETREQREQREGHCSVGHMDDEDDDGVTLHRIKRQRCENLDVTQEHFDSNFDLLLVFKEREGHMRVPIDHQESVNDNLGDWMKNQKSLHLRGALELDRQKWLEVAGVTWGRRVSLESVPVIEI
jgi:hypothetical protein